MLPVNLEYSKDDNGLTVYFSWYQPILVGVFLFSIFINALMFKSFIPFFFEGGDLVFQIIGATILLSTFLPLIYATLCFYFNKTDIHIDYTYLTVRHSPFPWWGGNKELLTKDIEQIFVVEKRRNEGANNYAVHARMVDGNDEVLLNLGLKVDQLKEFENRLEAYIGINNAPIIGEYIPEEKKSLGSVTKRSTNIRTDNPADLLYQINPGDYIYFQKEELKVNQSKQLDWNNGEIHKSFQFLDPSKKETLIFAKRNGSITTAYKEFKVSTTAVEAIPFREKEPPASIPFKGADYFLEAHAVGECFFSHLSETQKVEQWTYYNKGKSKQLRFLKLKNELHLYAGDETAPIEFTAADENLNLKELDIEYKTSDDQEDFV